jgi:hypothetical protein
MRAAFFISLSFIAASMSLSYGQIINNNADYTYERYTISGKKTSFGPFYAANLNCAPMEWLEVSITKHPEHGNATMFDRTVIMQYDKSNPRSSCNGKSIKGKVLEYVPSRDYKGDDEIVLETITSNGQRNTHTYKITVK